jgi:hypothetical protein
MECAPLHRRTGEHPTATPASTRSSTAARRPAPTAPEEVARVRRLLTRPYTHRAVRLDDIDLVTLDRFAAGFPHEVFTLLRREAPVWWHPPHPKAPGGEGFWVVSRHAEALASGRASCST